MIATLATLALILGAFVLGFAFGKGALDIEF